LTQKNSEKLILQSTRGSNSKIFKLGDTVRLLILFLCSSYLLWGDEGQLTLEVADEIDGYHHAESISKFFSLEPFIRGMQRFSQKKPYPQELVDKVDREFTQIWYDNFEKKAKDNLEKANQYLLELSHNPSIHFLEDGKIAYEIIQKRIDGDAITLSSEPNLRYWFQTIDGEEIVRVEKAVRIRLADVIPGFAIGILGMKKGERRKLFIHPDLAYRKLGNFPPNALLVAEVEVE
jgi:peptidylprolyl isomerase